MWLGILGYKYIASKIKVTNILDNPQVWADARSEWIEKKRKEKLK